MNRKNHIQKLVEILPPDYAAILNITTAHIGSQDIHNQNDIWESKKSIFKEVRQPILNIDYPIMEKHKKEFPNALSFGINKEKNPDLLGKVENNKLQIWHKKKLLLECSPYILTELSVYQILASTSIALQAKLSIENIRQGINSFTPKEHRILSYNNNNHKVIFDGDITLSARLKELANNFYSPTTLIISNLYTHNGNDTPANIEIQKQELADAFNKFGRVLVSDNIRDILLDKKLQKFQTFSPKDLEKMIKEQSHTYFIHHSVFFRNNIPEQKNGAYHELSFILNQFEKNSLFNRKLINKER